MWIYVLCFFVRPKFDSQGCVKTFPSFEQFLNYIIEKYKRKEKFDPHWSPYNIDCSPCILNYNAILKLESGTSDEDYMMSTSGLKELAEVEVLHVTDGGKSHSFIEEFYSQISCQTLEKLVEIYFMDFELYEYDDKLYFKICKTPTSEESVPFIKNS